MHRVTIMFMCLQCRVKPNIRCIEMLFEGPCAVQHTHLPVHQELKRWLYPNVGEELSVRLQRQVSGLIGNRPQLFDKFNTNLSSFFLIEARSGKGVKHRWDYIGLPQANAFVQRPRALGVEVLSQTMVSSDPSLTSMRGIEILEATKRDDGTQIDVLSLYGDGEVWL